MKKENKETVVECGLRMNRRLSGSPSSLICPSVLFSCLLSVLLLAIIYLKVKKENKETVVDDGLRMKQEIIMDAAVVGGKEGDITLPMIQVVKLPNNKNRRICFP